MSKHSGALSPRIRRRIFANGIWGQTIWVDEPRQVVIVKTSIDPDFQVHTAETIALMRGLSRPGLPRQ